MDKTCDQEVDAFLADEGKSAADYIAAVKQYQDIIDDLTYNCSKEVRKGIACGSGGFFAEASNFSCIMNAQSSGFDMVLKFSTLVECG